MSVKGERIRQFRKMRGMTQKNLGILLGFPEKSAEIRISQYEMGMRNPKQELTVVLAKALDVSEQALNVPDIENGLALMHLLFMLEDMWGLTVENIDGKCILTFAGDDRAKLREKLSDWSKKAEKLKAGEISKQEYDEWRYRYNTYSDVIN